MGENVMNNWTCMGMYAGMTKHICCWVFTVHNLLVLFQDKWVIKRSCRKKRWLGWPVTL